MIEQKISDLLSKEDLSNILGIDFSGMSLGKHLDLLDEVSEIILDLSNEGFSFPKYTPLASLKEGDPYTVVAVISKDIPIQEYTQKDGSLSSFLKIPLQDASGNIDLLLWEQESWETLGLQNLKKLSVLVIFGAKKSISRSSERLSLGDNYVIKVDPVGLDAEYVLGGGLVEFLSLIDVETNVGRVVDLKGIIVEKKDLHTFHRKNGTQGHVLHIRLFDSTATQSITLWDELAETVSTKPVSQEIILREMRIKSEDGMAVIHSSFRSTLE